jgi:hypothetical protein
MSAGERVPVAPENGLSAAALESVEAAVEPSRRGALTVVVCATAVAVLPMLVAAIRAIREKTVLLGDSAIVDQMVRSVWSWNPPLLGFYSRAGFYYPGPLAYYLTAPFTFVARGDAWGTVVGYAVLQAAAVVAAAWLMWRHGGHVAPVLAVLAADSLTYLGLRHWAPLTSPWNPYLALPFFVLLLVQAWVVAGGNLRHIPWALLTASFVVQANIGYGLIVVAIVVWFVVRAARDSKTTGRLSEYWSAIRMGAVVSAIVWMPAVLDALRGSGGNLKSIFDFFALHRDLPTLSPLDLRTGATLGPTTATKLLAAEFQLFPPWLGGRTEASGAVLADTSASPAWLLIPAIVLAVSYFRTRYRNRDVNNAIQLVLVAFVAAFFSLLMLDGAPGAFDFFWRIPIAILLVFSSIGAILVSTKVWRRSGIRVAVCAFLGIAIACSSFVTIDRVLRPTSGERRTQQVFHELIDQSARAGNRGDRIQLRGDIGLTSTLLNEFSERHWNVGVSEDVARLRYEGKNEMPTRRATAIWFAVSDFSVSLLAQRPGARVVAVSSPLTTVDERRLEQLQSEAAQGLQLGRYGALNSPQLPRLLEEHAGDAAVANELATLNERVARSRGWRYAVIEFAPGTAPIHPDPRCGICGVWP